MERSELETGTLIVGAGIAGLACARELARAGEKPLVIEKSRGVGGRCATRRIDGQPVDHGVAFLHGSSPDFLAELASVTTATPLRGWPLRIEGAGSPCQPRALAPGETRLAWAEGLTAFPKHLASGVETRLRCRVVRLARRAGGFVVEDDAGASWQPSTLVLTAPVEQTRELLEGLIPEDGQLATARELLRIVGTVPCLTLLAGYPGDGAAPAWDIHYPSGSPVLQLVSHDSSKRPTPRDVVLVLQAHPAWSREHFDQPAEHWASSMLTEAARLIGGWVSSPVWTETHRWHHARADSVSALTAPLLLRFDDGARLGLAGELFGPGGGVEAAWTAGRRLGRRLLGHE